MSRRINILFSFILFIFTSYIANANRVLLKDSVGVQIETDLLKLEIQIVKPNIAKLSYRLPDESYGEPTVSMNYSSKKNKIEFKEANDYYSLSTDSIEVRITKPDLYTMVYRKIDNTKLIDTIQFGTPNNYRGILEPQ